MHMVQFVTLLAQGTMCGGVAEIFFQRLFMLASTTARLSRCQPHVLVRRFRQGSTPSPPLSLGVVRASQFTTHIAQDQHGSRGSTDHFCGSSFYAPINSEFTDFLPWFKIAFTFGIKTETFPQTLI
jgi:hypothetical protein